MEELRKRIERSDEESIASSGIDFSEKMRSASFLQRDDSVVFSRSLSDGIDIMSIEEAFGEFPEIRDYYGKSFGMLGSGYPKDTKGGYFIRVKKGKTIEMPIQTCLFLKAQGFKQKVHNIIIVEEGARVYLITGCAASKAAGEAFHLGVSEFFIKKGGYLNFTMVHSWKEDISVKPISTALIEEDASFISNYICLRPVKEVVMYPTAMLLGKGARSSFNSLILSHPDTLQDIGARAIFRAENTRAEINTRAVSLGGKVIARGHLKAERTDAKAHLECRGLILSERGMIHAIPELETDLRDVDMSHEAAIGKISKEEVEYLCSRGFSRDEAQSIIVRGFMDVGILALPEVLTKEIKALEDKTLRADL